MSSQTKNDRILRAVRHYRACQDSFLNFIPAAFRILEHGRNYIHNWHIEVQAYHLQAVVEGHIRRLILGIPLRGMKSTVLSVMLPAWAWGPRNMPHLQFLSGSHDRDLAVRDCVATRALIQSEWYQTGWGHRFNFTTDQNQKTYYKNDKGGHRMTVGMTSGITGWDGDINWIDDAHDANKDGFSKQHRQNKINTYNNSFSNRLNDPNKSAIIVSGQRVAKDDLIGNILAKREQQWTHIKIPFTSTGKDVPEWDPRKKAGIYYWPERYGAEFVAEIKENLGSRGVACQLQQDPLDDEGGMIRKDWFKLYDELPPREDWIEVVLFIDTASKDNEIANCPWCFMVVVQTVRGYYIKEVVRDWLTYPDGKERAREISFEHHVSAIVIEDKSTGESLNQELPSMVRAGVLPFPPEGDKDTRLYTESPAIEAGKVWLPRFAPWRITYEEELCAAPNSAYKDQCDVTSMMLRWFRERSYAVCDLSANTEGWPSE